MNYCNAPVAQQEGFLSRIDSQCIRLTDIAVRLEKTGAALFGSVPQDVGSGAALSSSPPSLESLLDHLGVVISRIDSATDRIAGAF